MRKSSFIWGLFLAVSATIVAIILFTFLGLEVYFAATATNDTAILFHTQVVLAVLQGASLLFLVVYVVKTWEMAYATRRSVELGEKTFREMQDARDQETAPYVVLYFDIPYGQMYMYLVVKNIGKTTAHNIRFEINPPLAVSWEPLPELPFGQDDQVIASLPPNNEIRTIFDETEHYFGQYLPLKYSTKIFYNGGIRSETRSNEQVIDLSIYSKVSWFEEDKTKEARKSKELYFFRVDFN
jgi:hypothetical protein